MTTFKKGDIVICKKYTVGEYLSADGYGMRYENYIDACYFNREAVVKETYKELMQRKGFDCKDDKNEYVLQFLDNGSECAWFDAKDIVLKYPHYFTFERMPNLETLKKRNQCDFCKKIDDVLSFHIDVPNDDGMKYSVNNIKFCPCCGRKLKF